MKEGEKDDEKVVKLEGTDSTNNATKLQKESRQSTNEKSKISIKKPKIKVGKTKNKSRKTRSLFSNYFMSRRRFYKLMETKMDRWLAKLI